MELWAVEFWHPSEAALVIRIFESQDEARRKMLEWSPFDPVAWEL